MNYSSPFCPDDAEVFTTNGKMKISKLYYKMNPKRDPYNRILDIQNIFLSKCISDNINKNNEPKKKKEQNLKEIKDLNEYYNNINKSISNKSNDINNYQISLNQEEVPYFFNDYSTIFQTSIKVNNTNYKNKNISCSESKFNYNNGSDICSKRSSNINNNNSSINYEQTKSTFNRAKILNKNNSHSYILKLDKTYYKSPTLNKKICVLGPKKRKIYNSSKFSLSNNSSLVFNDNDMAKYNDYIPFAKQNYLNGQFDFDLSKKTALTQLKQYQIKETQNRNKVKPFVY